MKKEILLFIKGFIIGIGKIIPGVSGSLLALSLGLYEKAIDSISNFFKDIKGNSHFLFVLGLGILVSIIFGSNIVGYLLNHFYAYTMFLFIGLILGSIIDLKNNFSVRDYLVTSLIFLISIIFFINFNFSINMNNTNYLYIIFLGFVEALTSLIPGISGTAIYIMLNSYEFVLSIFQNPFNNFLILFLFGIGILLGVFLLAKIINYLIKNNFKSIYSIILGFSLSSLYYLLENALYKVYLPYQLFVSFFILIIGYVISRKLTT